MLIYFNILDSILSNESKLNSIYSQCKLNKLLCFGLPDGCVHNQNCAILSTAVKADDNGTVNFELLSPLNSSTKNHYIALSLSNKTSMNGNVIYCYLNDNGKGKIGIGDIHGRKVIHLNSVDGISLNSVTFENSLLSCRWSRQPKTVVDGYQYDLINNKYHIELAKGNMKGGN